MTVFLCHPDCKYRTPTWQWQKFTSHLLLWMLFCGTSGNYAGNLARKTL